MEISEIIKEATCVETGIVRRYCSVEGCGEYTELVIPMKAHTEAEWMTEKEATCTEDGLKVQKCAVCGTVLKEEILEAVGHKYGEWETIQEASIGIEGLKERTCSACGDVEKQVIPAIEHGAEDHVFDGREEVIKEATCTNEGILRKYCSVEGCNAYIEESIPMKDHTAGEWTIGKEATCTEDGSRIQKCTECGVILKEELVEATGHSYGEWTVVKEPDVGEEGLKERICSVCGEKEEQVIDALEEEPETDEPGNVNPDEDDQTNNQSGNNSQQNNTGDVNTQQPVKNSVNGGKKNAEKQKNTAKAVKTGDNSDVLVFGVLMVCAALVAGTTVVVRRRK